MRLFRRQPRNLFMDFGAQNPPETPWWWHCFKCGAEGWVETREDGIAAYRRHTHRRTK